MPWYKNFKGTIQTIDETRYASFGEAFVVDDNTLVITELPLRTWTQNYKENVLESMLNTNIIRFTVLSLSHTHSLLQSLFTLPNSTLLH